MPYQLDWVAAEAAVERFTNMDSVRKTLQLGLIASQQHPLSSNIILWGQGGYGKSEFAFDYLKAATGLTPFVKSLHRESSIGELYGGMDIPSLQNGELRYLVENSWMNHEIVIFEEAFDAQPALLASMKDLITRRKFTIGQDFDIKTEIIVINTNVDPSSFRTDLSKAALLERFPFVRRVDWSNLGLRDLEENYGRIVDYHSANGMGIKLNADVRKMLVHLASNEMWSPRRLIQIVRAIQADAYLNNGNKRSNANTDNLRSVAFELKFDTADVLQQIERQERKEQIEEFQTTIRGYLKLYRDSLSNLPLPAKTMADVAEVKNRCVAVKEKLQVVVDNCVNVRNQFGSDSNKVVDELLMEVEDVRGLADKTWMDMI